MCFLVKIGNCKDTHFLLFSRQFAFLQMKQPAPSLPFTGHHIHTCPLPGPPPLEASGLSVPLLDVEFSTPKTPLQRVTSPPTCITHSIPHALSEILCTVLSTLRSFCSLIWALLWLLKITLPHGINVSNEYLRFFFLELLNTEPGVPHYTWAIDFRTFQCTSYLKVWEFPPSHNQLAVYTEGAKNWSCTNGGI